jgi:cation transport regulator
MTYNRIEDLPDDVKNQLPPEAQQTFVENYNRSFIGGVGEESSLQVAWDAVKLNYEQGDGERWRRKPEGAGEAD